MVCGCKLVWLWCVGVVWMKMDVARMKVGVLRV